MTLDTNDAGSSPYLYRMIEFCSAFRREYHARLLAEITAKFGGFTGVFTKEPGRVLELINDEDEDSRRLAVIYLSRFEPRLHEYRELLQKLAISDGSPRVRSAATTALGTIGSHHHTHEIATLLYGMLMDKNEHGSVRRAAYSAMECIDLSTRGDVGVAELDAFFEIAMNMRDAATSVEECIDPDLIERLMRADRA